MSSAMQITFANWQKRFEQHWIVALAALLALVNLVTFAPTFTMGFVTDDFIEVGARHDDALDSIAREDWSLWFQRFGERALIDPVSGVEIFRPTRQVIFWADYFTWHLNPLGFHITNVLLQFATCFVVALLTWQLTRRRSAAFVAGLLFALHPAHTAPISEIASRGHVLAGLFVALTVLFYVLPRTRGNQILALLACVLAIGSKETALVTPALLALYEVIYHHDEIWRSPQRVMLRQLPFWLITAGAIALRFLIFGRLSGSQYGIGSWSLTYQIQGYSLFTLEPFIVDISDLQTILFLLILLILMILYRARREVRFGILWLPVALFFTLASPPQERYFYTPSIGLALAFGSIFSQPLTPSVRWARWASAAVTAALCLSLGAGAIARVSSYRNAGEIVQTILAQVKTLHPTLPQNSRLVFVGLPEVIRQGYIFNAPLQVQYAMQWLYNDRTLQATSGTTFPVVLDAPDRTFFFEYARRKITERADLVQALRDRRRCSDSPQNRIVWNFRTDGEGWESWNEIDAWSAGQGALRFRTTGNDPFLGSPFIQVRPHQLTEVAIQMRARAAQPTFTAELYWQTTDMQDFSGDAHTTFQVNADNVSHLYKLRLATRGDAPIVRLRFDPSNLPAEIELERISIQCK